MLIPKSINGDLTVWINNNIADPTDLPGLLGQFNGPVDPFTADGPYDGSSISNAPPELRLE